MAVVFCKQRFDFVRKTTIEKLKKKNSRNPNTVKSTSFWLNRTLGSDNGDVPETLLENGLRILSNHFAIIPSRPVT